MIPYSNNKPTEVIILSPRSTNSYRITSKLMNEQILYSITPPKNCSVITKIIISLYVCSILITNVITVLYGINYFHYQSDNNHENNLSHIIL